jgi:hypothetical protein
MAQPSWLKKYLTMKPEVVKVFELIEAYHDHCRMELVHFNPADINNNRNPNWKNFARSQRTR